ncbi:MAG: ABC transporter substrate-binding protein [Planctomycetes bacterium]|nr:ABC transporter substrate-binding protein [Planctomycetota bacterium]
MARWLLIGLVLLAAAVTGCRPAAAPSAADGPPQRILSLFPSWTEVLCALGLGDRLVGRSRHCDHPPEVTRLPVVGEGFGGSLEAILRLRPDLVVVYDRDLADRIRRLDLRALSVQAESLDEVFAAYETIARAAGVPGRGRALADRVRGEIAEASRLAAGAPRPRVLFCVDGKSGHVVGPRNFVHELLLAVGADNVAADAAGPFPVYSLEAALRKDPELILDGSGTNGAAAVPGARTFIEGLRTTTAGRRGRIVPVSEAVVTRSGPRLGEAARLLARIIHEAP